MTDDTLEALRDAARALDEAADTFGAILHGLPRGGIETAAKVFREAADAAHKASRAAPAPSRAQAKCPNCGGRTDDVNHRGDDPDYGFDDLPAAAPSGPREDR